MDIGCAWGRVSIVLSHLAFHVTSLDIEAREFWNEINGDFVKGDAHNLPFGNSTFDLVTCYELLEHVSSDEEVVKEIHRVLKRGSPLLVQVPHEGNLHNKLMGRKLSPRHKREYTVEQITDLLTSVGFKIERVWIDAFYAPVFTRTINKMLSSERRIWLGNLLPKRHRGIITVRCRKPA